MIKNISQLPKDIKKLESEIEMEFSQHLKGAARVGVRSLIYHSPVDSGTYVANHQFGINGPAVGIPDMTGYGVSRKSQMHGIKMRELKSLLAKVKLINKETKSIYISNEVPYADKVEWLGWPKTPAKAVYQKARKAMVRYIVRTQTKYNAKVLK